MNQNRAQRFPAALLAWLGLILGFSFGLFLDQAANLPFDGNLLPALKACGYCIQAAWPVAAEAAKVNRWTLLGSIIGLLAGVLVGVLPHLLPQKPTSQPKRLSSFRQAAELARFSRALSDTLELQPILNQLHEEVLRVSGADCGSTFLLDPESPEHRVALRVGEGVELHRLSPMEATVVSAGRGRSVQDFELEGEAPPHVGVRSALLVPVTYEDNPIGLIHLHSQQPNAFDSEIHDFVQVLATQAAVAIQNARRYAEQSRRNEGLRQRVNQLQQLSQIPNAVRVDRPLTVNLKAISQTMQETADFSLVLISVFAPAGNQLVHTAAAGLAPEAFENLQHLPLPWERLQPFLREENRSDRVYRVPHTQTADLYQALDLGRPKPAAEVSTPGQWHPDDMLLVPLYGSRGDIDGLLSVGAPRDTGTPQSLVLEMLEIFASQAALAIENAQLVTQAEARVSESQERAVQLSALTEAAGVIATALRVDDVVTLALDQLRRVIPYDTATLWQRELGDGNWRVLGARSYVDSIERVIGRIAGAQATVFSEITTTRSVVFVPDVSRDERFSAKDASSMRSWLGVPVLTNGEVLGILSLEKGEDNFYGPARVPLALSFAHRVAAALENARLYEESVQRAQELEKENARRAQDVDLRSQRLALLNGIATNLSQARDLAGLLQLTLETLSQALGVERASGMIFDGEAPRDSAHILASGWLPASTTAAPAALELANNPLLDRLQQSGSPLIAEAGSSPAETVIRPEHLAWLGADVAAALFLPLIAEGHLLGVFGLGAAAGRKFTVADADLGRAIVQQTVTALQYFQLRDRTQEQAGVQQLTRAIGRAADFNQLYQDIRTQLAEVAGIQSFSLALYDPARNQVVFPLIVEKGQLVNVAGAIEGRTPGGLVGYIVQTRQAVRLSGDVAAQAKKLGLALGLPGQHPVRGAPEAESGPLAKAYLGVPLQVGDKPIGVLVAQDLEQPGAFDDRAERILSASGSQIALAVDNLRLFEQARESLAASQERATQFETLTQAAVALAATLHSNEVIAAALEQIRRLVPYDGATFWQREAAPSGRRGAAANWRVVAARGYANEPDRTGQIRTIEPRTPLGDVVAARRTLMVPDTRQDTRFQGAGLAGAWMGVPVVSQGEVVAIVELEKSEAGAYTPVLAPLAQSLATRIALALNNAEQYEASLSQKNELAEQARRQAILTRAATALSGLLDLGEALAATLRLLTDALGVDRAGVVVFDEDTAKPLRAARLPASAESSLAGLTGTALVERLRHAGTVLTLDELAAEQPMTPDQTAWVGGGVAAGLFRLLVFNGQTVGVLGAGQALAGRAFSAAEISLAQDLCRLAAAAVYEARQYEAAQLRLSEQALVTQIGRAISQALDVRQLGQLLRAQLDAWLSPGRVWLALYDEARHEVSFALAIADGQTQAISPQAPDGLLRQILQTQQSLLLPGGNDLPQQLQALGLPADALAPASSYLGVPLVLGAAEAARVVGVLALADPSRARRLTESHQRVLAAVAAQVAISLDNARLYSVSLARVLELDERAQRLAWLNHTAAALGSTLDLEALLPVALRALTELLPAENASAVLFDEPLETARVIARLGPSLPEAAGEPRAATFSLAGEGWWQRMLPRLRESSAPLALNDLNAGPGLAPLTWLGAKIDSALLLPMHSTSGLIGLIALGRVQAEPEGYPASQLPLAQALAQQAGIAFENARRYEDSLLRAQDFERRGALLARAAAEFSGNLDLNSLLAVALRTIAESLGADQAGILIFASPDSPVDLTTLERPMAWAQFPPADTQAAAPAVIGNALLERLRQAQSPLAVDDLPENRLVGAAQVEWVGVGLQAAVFYPLLAGGRQMGALGLGFAKPHAFTPAEIDLGQMLASQATAAANNALRFFDLQQRLSEQTVVNQVIRALGRAGDLQQLVDILRARVGNWVPAESLSLALYDEGRNEITLPLWLENGRAREMAPFAPGGILRHVLQTRHALRLGGDVTAQSRELGIPISFIAHRPMRWTADSADVLTSESYLGVPILFGDKALGVLAVEVAGRPQAFDERHERILTTVAAQVAVVIDNRRLFEQTNEALAVAQERVTQLEALAAALSVIASALYSEDVVGVTLEQFERVIPYDRAAFWRREAGAGGARELRWRAADARGYPDSPDQLTQLLVADGRQLALFAELVSTRRMVMVADTAQDTRFQTGGERPTRSWLGVPLVNKGEVIGLLIAEKVEPNTYRASHAASAQILASQITAVLTNTYEYEESVQRVLELDERSRRLAFLNRFAAELGGNLNLGSILQFSLKALAESLGVDQATAAVFDETRSGVLALEHYPEIRGARHLALPGNSLIERFQETPAPITIEDLAGPEAPARLRQADWIGQEVRAAMFLPLMSAGKLIGLIGLGQSMAGRRFTPGETELSMGLANLTAVAAQNARLYDRTQQRLAEQAGINQITRALAKSLEPRALYANLREQIEAWVGADQIYLAAYDESRNEVSFPLAEVGGQSVAVEPRAPTGLVGHLLQQLEPVRLNGEISQRLKELGLYDTGLGSRADASLDQAANWTSCLGVPLVNNERVIGALILANPKRAETFDENHEHVLSAVAAQVAAALGQAHQFEQSRQMTLATQTRAAQLSVLSEATSIIASAMRSEQVIELALDQLQRVIAYDSASLWRRDGADGSWRLAAVRGHAAGQVGQVTDLSAPEQDPVAEVASTRGSLVITDAGQDSRFAGQEHRPGSWLGFPLIYQGELLGIIAVEKAERNSLGAAHASLALAFANQTAVTLANVRQYEDSLRRAFELDERSALLNRASARLSQANEPRDVLVAALQALVEALGTNRGAAILFDEGHAATRHARVLARYPASQDETNPLPMTANGLLDQLRASLAPVAARDVAAESLILPEYAAWIGPDIQSALFLPLAVAGKLIGVIGLGHAGQRRVFVAGEVELAMTLCNQAAIAAHNARLYRQTQRRLTEIAAITQTSRSISQTIDLRQVFATVRNEVEANLHADSYFVAVYDEAKNEVSYPVAVTQGQDVEVIARAPDPLIAHILKTRQSLLLTGDVGATLADLGLLPPGSAEAEVRAVVRAKAYLGVPLLSGIHVLGVLAIEDYQRAFAFTDKHVRSAATIATPLAAAVDGARLYEDSAQRALALDSRAALLGRLSAELGEATSLTTIVQFIAQVAAETLMADVGAALILDEAPGALLPVASARFPDDAAGELPVFVAAGSPIIKQLQTAPAPITLDEMSSDPQARAELTAWLGQDVGAAVFMPLITADKLIGFVAAAQLGRQRRFTSGEVDLAMSLANQAAVAAANARLQEKMQPRLIELAAISRICQAISGATSLAQLCDILIAEISSALDTSTIVLAVYDSGSEALSFPLVFHAGQRLTASSRAPDGQLGYILRKHSSLLLNGQIEAQLEQLGLAYQPLLAGDRVPLSYLGVPLVLGNQVIGVLSVEGQKQVSQFNPSHEFILNTVAAPIAVTIDNLRLQAERDVRGRELAERTTQLASLNRLSTSLIGSLEPATILRQTLDELAVAIPAEHLAGLLLDPSSATMRVAGLVRLPAAGNAHGVPPMEAPSAEAVDSLAQVLSQARGPFAAGDLADDARLGREQTAWLAPEPRAVLLLPMMIDEKLAGVIGLARGQAGRPFSAGEIELATTCAGQAAMAIASARLFEAAHQAQQMAQAQTAQFNLLAEASEGLAKGTTAEAVASTAIAELARALPYDRIAFYRLEVGGAGAPDRLRLIGSANRAGAAEPLGQTLDPAEQPFLAESLAAAAPLLVTDAQTDGRFTVPASQATPSSRAWMGIPVRAGEVALGLIVLSSAEPGAYQANHLELARKLSGLIAAAVESVEQRDVSIQRTGRLEADLYEQAALNRLGQAVSQAADLAQIQSVLAAEIAGLFGTQTWYLALQMADAHEVSFVALVENGQPRQIQPLAPEGVVEYILINRVPLSLSGDIGSQLKAMSLPHRGNRARREAGDPSAAKAFLGVPLLAEQQAIGVLAVENAQQAEAFGDRQLHLLQTVADQVSASIKRLRGAEHVEETQRQLEEYRALHEQNGQKTEALSLEMQDQAAALARLETEHERTAQSLENQLREQTEALRRWHERVVSLLADQAKLRPPAPLGDLLSLELLIASHALSAEAGAIYLSQSGSGRLVSHTDYGLVEALPAGVVRDEGLLGAAVAGRQSIVVDDLAADPRWTTSPSTSPHAPANGNGNGSGGSNGRAPSESALDNGATPEFHAEALANNGHYRSALVVPLVAGEQALGALLFLSARPAAFGQASLPVADAAAHQVAFAVQAATQNQTWREQTEALEQWIAEAMPAVTEPVMEADATLQRKPVTPVIAPALPLEPARPVNMPENAPKRPAAWRRLTLPAGALLLVACLAGAAVANGGALKQAAATFLGGAGPTATPAATSVATVPPTPARPTAAPTSVPASPVAQATLAPATATTTLPPTATPAATATLLPSVSPTAPLPPDVIGVATVLLPQGVAGRLRDAPNGLVIGGVPGNTVVHVLAGRQTTDDGIVWVHIRLPATGQTGWFSESLLKYVATPVP